MIKTLIYILIVGLSSCKSLHIDRGEYYKKGKDYTYSLKLTEDSTFILSKKYQDAFPQCSGKWSYIAKDTILLKCDEMKDVMESLTNGYMAERENRLIVLNQNKVKLGKVILTKIKE